MKKAYFVDVSKKIPTVETSEGDELKKDLEFFQVSRPEDVTLVSPSIRVFKTKKAADKFLEKYLTVFYELDKKVKCHSKNIPSILMKKHFIALSVMNLKLSTTRTGERLKNANVGDLINMYDQTHFHTVKLVSKERSGMNYVYNFTSI